MNISKVSSPVPFPTVSTQKTKSPQPPGASVTNTVCQQFKSSVACLDPAVFRILFVGPVVTFATLPGESFSNKLINYLGGKSGFPKLDQTLFHGASFVVGLRIATRSTVFTVQDATSQQLSTAFSKSSLSDNAKNFVSGVLSGAIAGLSETLFHPLGQINTRIQTASNLSIIDAAKRLYQSGQMFRGIGITACRDVTSATITFTTLQLLKGWYEETELKTPKTMATIGAISGAVSGAATAIPAIILNQLASNPMAKIQLPGLLTVLITAVARSLTLGTVVGVMSGTKALHAQLQNPLLNQA